MSRPYAWIGRLPVVVAIVWAALLLASPVAGQEPAASDLARLEAVKLQLDQAETRLQRETLSVQALYDLGQNINPVLDGLRRRIAEIDPGLKQIEARLKQLGPGPAKDAPPENAQLAEERARLNQEFSARDAAVKQARLLLARAEQLVDDASERRREMYTKHLFARSVSLFSPALWSDLARPLGREWSRLRELLRAWWDLLRDPANALQALWAVLALVALGMVTLLVWRWWQRQLAATPEPTTRFGKALGSLGVLLGVALTAPLAVFAAIEVLESFDLLPDSLSKIAYGLGLAVALAAFGRAVAIGVLAPDAPGRRLLAVDDDLAQSLTRHLVWAARAMALGAFLLAVHHVLDAAPVVIAATSMLFAFAIAALLLHLLWASSRRTAEEHALAGALWLRAIGWLFVVAIGAAVALGYSRFAAFLAVRLLITIAVGGTLYLLLVLTHTLFIERLAASTARGRAFAANLGVSPRRLGLIATLMSGAICVLLILVALTMVIGPWGIAAGDLIDVVRSLAFGLRFGDLTISFAAVLMAVIVLLVALAITRLLQRWLERQLLPRTEIEPSLQQSIAAIVGYVGVIVAVVLALSQLGIDLQKVALIAGALSVGIGFGLQSIVSNFVSGLILLAERPIRIGDWVVVKGEEGYVRRIRVRATEIETFDRASVIIPNADFITGAVKNWTHGDTTGRVVTKVAVQFDSDPDKVSEALLACAAENGRLLKNPPPRAFFVGFGATGLEFELRGYVGNIEDGLSVRSNLNVAILKRFRAGGIALPAPPQPPPTAA